MNYYERHLGDYAKDTGHLSQAEHGAYNLLIDRYYTTEKGIPAELVYKIGKAKTKAEKAAVDFVLSEFFELVEGVWIKGRIEGEISRAQKKIEAARNNGMNGGRPKNPEKHQENQDNEKPDGFELGSENKTQQKAHQTPDTRHQSPLENGGNTQESSAAPESDARVHTPAGMVCRRMIDLGIEPTTCNPGHQTLAALLEAGAELIEFEGAARSAVAKGKPDFKYAVGIVKKQREDAAKLVLHKGTLPGEVGNDQAREGARKRLFGGEENAAA